VDNEEVELDVRLPVTQNSQVYYDRSKKLSGKDKRRTYCDRRNKEMTGKKEVPKISKKSRSQTKVVEQFRWFSHLMDSLLSGEGMPEQ